MAVMVTVYGLYTILGAIFGFRHLYCSLQNANHQKMSPNIRKSQLTPKMKKELIGVGSIFSFMGMVLLIIQLFFPGA